MTNRLQSLDDFKFEFRKLIIEHEKLRTEVKEAEEAYEEAYDVLEASKGKLKAHGADIGTFIVTVLGGNSLSKLKLVIVSNEDPISESISIEGVVVGDSK